jgi:TonB-dependent SusC/RagA subfamily outer membrane receptor
MKLLGVLLSATTLAVTPLTGQTTLLVGRILDSATTKPITAGWVTIMGTALSAPLREDGSFALSVPVREVTVSIRADGYKPREVQVRPGDDLVEIRVARDYFQQEQAIISGQATSVERKNNPTTVARVGADDIAKSSAHDMNQALSGHVTGAQVAQAPNPGAAMFLRLRGMTTFMGNQSPLYIIDGITVASIDAINPNDIEDIQILKGASAGAMYGSKASNGVVIIKTKRGGLSSRPRDK